MSTIARAQRAFEAWLDDLAEATGGKHFTTFGCRWVWLPTRRRLVLLFPEAPEAGGLRPGLAEGARLGAVEVHAWLNAGVRGHALEDLGFTEQAPLLWHAGIPTTTLPVIRPGQTLPAPPPFPPSIPAPPRTGTQPRTGTPPRQGPAAPTAPGAADAAPDGLTVQLGGPVEEARGADAAELAVADGRWPVRHATVRNARGEPVGHGFARIGPDGLVSLHGVAVSPAWRHQGAGKALVRALTSGAPEIVAAAGPGATPFLEACGLGLVGRGRHLILRF
ncbi:hypothetical protein NCCP1664_07040 [Zafaria cholistanensis]|uniref:N-acetyltransferase domain-containing protein n=1 Tax=Zafaria cholistanensis TaxID=1682741 RepID=A0A5A7NQF7_9MICC|nr:GNAT family N-acetyltransferase [Zafaria cholistanensis]GER22207.1 hypothetical protein NCCP1664_07040 [Zafaria cholistanensis]